MKRYIPIVIVVATILTSCKTRVQYVPVDNVRIEYRDKHTVDSITTIDTVRIAERGDTVYIERLRYRDKVKMQVDTFLRVDTVTRVQTVEVQAKLSTWDRIHNTVDKIGAIAVWAAMMAALFVVCYYGVKLYRRLR